VFVSVVDGGGEGAYLASQVEAAGLEGVGQESGCHGGGVWDEDEEIQSNKAHLFGVCPSLCALAPNAGNPDIDVTENVLHRKCYNCLEEQRIVETVT
jgi:hypothetical protein